LRKRLVEITRLVRLTVRQAEYALKAFYDDGSGVDKEIPEAGIEVKPGSKGRVTFFRLDHTWTNHVKIAIDTNMSISPPAAKEWLPYETATKQKLTRLEKALGVTDPDWSEAAKMSQAIKATDLQDEKNKESLAALQKKIDDFWERNGKVVAAEKKVLDAIERLHLCEVALENGKGYQIPPKGTEDSRKDNRFEEKRSAWEARLTNWIATVACADAPLDTRAKRLSEGLTFLTNSVVHDLLAAIPREDAVERIKKAQNIFVLCVTNQSGQKIDVVAGDNHKEIADAGGWTVRRSATTETLSVEAKAARCLPKTNNVFLMAGGGTTVVVKGFKQILEGRLKVVGWEALDPPADLTVKPTAGGLSIEVKKNDETPLPFSKYILTGIRPDYENVNKPVVIDSEAIREVDLSANEWKPGKALSALLAAETAWDRERTVAAAKAYADVGELTYEGHKDRNVKLKEKIETHFDVEGKKYVSELQKARREQELWVFQVADPDNGDPDKSPQSRKEANERKPELPTFDAVDYVSKEVKAAIVDAKAEKPSIPEAVKDAHRDDSFRDDFPGKPVNLLAEAVRDQKYVPNKYDVALAKYMCKKCRDWRDAKKIKEDEKRKKIPPHDENGFTNWQTNVDANDANLAKVVNNLKVITKAFENVK
jgi:hypothetical protein